MAMRTLRELPGLDTSTAYNFQGVSAPRDNPQPWGQEPGNKCPSLLSFGSIILGGIFNLPLRRSQQDQTPIAYPVTLIMHHYLSFSSLPVLPLLTSCFLGSCSHKLPASKSLWKVYFQEKFKLFDKIASNQKQPFQCP